MAPVLPSSLSPHVCILPSPDLSELLQESGLPSLPNILQSFSPLPQVTTRTSSLVSVPHSSFALRFSDLTEVEDACREPEEQRAARTLDWMALRIAKRCDDWVKDAQERGEMGGSRDDRIKSPWWDEIRRCAEGDFIPDKNEGWNHPVAVILAVSTSAPNPLAAINELHSRPLRLPSWVDPSFLKYTLIVHPKNSPLSDEETNALFNAVKRQYGLHTYLLPLSLPSPPPPPIPVPALLPRLPPPPGPESPYLTRQGNPNVIPPTPKTANAPDIPSNPFVLNTLRLEEKDIQATARFTREFVVMSMIPWMERCVVEWNEAYSSTRRLPSRLFSSTRRLFGSSPSPSPGPGHSSSSSVSSLPGRANSISLPNGSQAFLPQHRRLAEFSTILGDFKLAIQLWESIRKEGKGGSDIIPILSAPTPALQLHASNALLAIHPTIEDLPPNAQLRALLYAVRWETAIDQNDFLSNALEGERWLVWAAGNAEEAPAALLLAQAALLSTTKKKAFRRAAFWYASAANRLEKCGIKPLTMYFLKKAHELYQVRPPKLLSPSFWESEGKSPSSPEKFVDVKAGIEHPLARLLYTTGNITDAVRMFIQALRVLEHPTLQAIHRLESPIPDDAELSQDKTFLDDFRVAYAHLTATDPEAFKAIDLHLPLQFISSKQTKLRFAADSKPVRTEIRERREAQWTSFRKSKGEKGTLVAEGKVCVGETFWVDLAVNNPLDTDVDMTNLSLVIESSIPDVPVDLVLEAEVVEEVMLRARESRLIPIALKALQSMTISISHVKYDFLSILPVTESLASKGRRLHETQAQRLTATYAPDNVLKADILPRENKLLATFIDDGDLVLKQGEICEMKVLLRNTGTAPVGEIWLVAGGEQEIWMGEDETSAICQTDSEVVRSSNSMRHREPQLVSTDEPLQPDETVEVLLCMHGQCPGRQDLHIMFMFRETESSPFHSTQLDRSFGVQELLEVTASASPSRSRDHSFTLNVEVASLAPYSSVSVTQICTISPLWKLSSISTMETSIPSSQTSQSMLGAQQWTDGQGTKESMDFLLKKLEAVLAGELPSGSEPPEIDLICSHSIESSSPRRSLHSPSLWGLIQSGRRRFSLDSNTQQHPHIPEDTHPNIFPLYNPTDVDVVVFWEMPSEQRKGYIVVHGVKMGATHGALNEIISNAENSKVKRSMYAETVREKAELVEGLRNCEWNEDIDPTAVTVEGAEVVHDFNQGSSHVPVKIVLKNNSSLYETQVTLRLRARALPTRPNPIALISPAPYSGRLTYREKLAPGAIAVIQPRLLIDRAGLYRIGGFVLETELLDPSSKRRSPYIQEVPPSTEVCIVARQL